MMTNNSVQAGDKVRFSAPLSNGGTARWTATVVRVENGVAFVRHPSAARNMPFSPVPVQGLYKYDAAKLAANKVNL